ncbi:MAG: ABC transporter substrate-binding protein [Actinomycetota bacterium]
MSKRWLKLLGVLLALGMIAAACGDSDDDDSGDDGGDTTEADAGAEGGDDGGDGGAEGADFDGAVVTITGPERTDQDVGSINDALNQWAEGVGITVEYTGDADWEANINTQVEGGNPPDISFFPQPGKLADFARAGSIVALTDAVNQSIDDNWLPGFQLLGEVDGTQYGVPAKTDLKSLVWYQPARFEAAGYSVPETFDEFTALVAEMAAADGPRPLCVGIESGQATGWPFTDWVEEMMLRLHGPDVYDQWLTNELPFDSPEVQEAMQAVVDLWAEDNVFASSGSVSATNFGDNAQPLVDGQCYMHRQANFFGGFFPEGTPFADGSEGAVDVFYFPDINDDAPILIAGVFAGAFNDDPATMAVMEYLATSDYAENRQRIQAELLGGTDITGYLSGSNGQDVSVYSPLEQSFLEIINNAAIARFDGSDVMPADVGAGTFWTEGTSVVNGDIDVATAAQRIQESWPAS